MADLSGAWLGTYWQAGLPTRFEASLIQGRGHLSGSVLDDSYLGEARIQGAVTGRRIHFTKRYLTTSTEPVEYIGVLSEDEEQMQGHWQIGMYLSGEWEAHRSGENLVIDRAVYDRLATPVS